VLFLSAWVALAPGLAEARAGGGGSQGSRGSRTYESNGTRPMERSIAPQAPTTQRPYTQPAPQSQLAQRPGFFSGSPFLRGLVGGFIGAGIFGMLFGHSAWAADGSSISSFLGMLIQFAIIAGLIWLAIRLFRSRSRPGYAGAGGGSDDADRGYARSAGAMAASSSQATRGNPIEFPVTEADYNEWGALLVDIQDAWSRGDLTRLRQYVTPEMLSYFGEELARYASQGVENRVEQVTLLKGDVEEAWREDGMEYVTARLRWSAIDYKVRTGTNQVVEGDPNVPAEATEVWTFVRSASGGRWILSAIQQV
jgi:predicted lipid-binding transport protein (Tim44 family)